MTKRLSTLAEPRDRFGIVVDGNVISAPKTVPISGGKAEITGNFTETTAKTLANQLKFGALPFSFTELTSSQISPQLGSEQLRNGIIAGIIGLILVVLYSWRSTGCSDWSPSHHWSPPRSSRMRR